MDGTLGSRTALLLDGVGHADHGPRGPGRGHPRRRARPASRSPCTRSATSPTARRSTRSRRRRRVAPAGLRHRIEHAQCVHAEDIARFAAPRHHRLGAVHPRHQRPRAGRADVGRPPRPRLPVPAAARRRRAPGRRLGRAGRGARPARRPARRRGVRRLRRRRRSASFTVAPAWLSSPSTAAAASQPASTPTSSCSTATACARRWSPGAGSTVSPRSRLERRRHPLRARADALAQRPHVGRQLGLLRRLGRRRDGHELRAHRVELDEDPLHLREEALELLLHPLQRRELRAQRLDQLRLRRVALAACCEARLDRARAACRTSASHSSCARVAVASIAATKRSISSATSS